MKPLLFTGPPGVGKSTAVRKVTDAPGLAGVHGLYSGEIRVDGKRQGFELELLPSGEKGVLASPDIEGEVRFGTLRADGKRRLGLSLAFLDEVACPALRAALPTAQLMVIDEIGPMQARSEVFRCLVEEIIASDVPLLATVALAEDEWIAGLRESSDCATVALTVGNRDTVAEAAAHYLKARLAQEARSV
ncbi:nucleoside-triphosphatase [Streptomyces sp. NPDC096094]|uniref:nucleoside-triphosphatase n=1 Tax=Streptomyces sp. NPDC096094 TaxID=3366073 RepID=UPI003823A845